MAQLRSGDPWHVGPYEVIARLTTDEGAASIGRLYLARFPEAGQLALRVIAPRLAADAALRGKLSDGVAAARTVVGPSVCPIRAAAILSEPTPWIAWEFTPGPSLAAVLAEYGRLPEAAIARLAAGLAQALRAIHDAGAVHGDLRPATIFQADGKPRVTGLGVAAAVQAAALLAPGASQLPDARVFIAPELASGAPIGPVVDMFSLGAVVAFAAGGKGPFGIGGPAGSPHHAPYGVPDLGGTPMALRPLITRCLDADPSWRPTPGEFLSLVTALFPDALEPEQWPDVEVSDPVPEPPAPALVSAAPAAVTGAPPAAPHQVAPASPVTPASPAPLRPAVTPSAGRPSTGSPSASKAQKKWAIILGCVGFVLLVSVIGWANTGSAPPQPAGAQTLYYSDYHAGDCLYGDLPNSGGGTWPWSTWQVPCDHPHDDEVFYANANFWPADAPYPGTQALSDQGHAFCAGKFAEYVGVADTASAYGWTYVTPEPASEWQWGDRELACMAYVPFSAPGSQEMTGSIKGSGQ